MNLDDLFGPGVELGGDFVVKAQLKVSLREHALPAAADIVAKMAAAYAERLDDICEDIEHVLGSADARKSIGLFVVDGGLGGNDLAKALIAKAGNVRAGGAAAQKPKQVGPRQIHTPGSRGGKFYRDKHGNVRYGTAPQGEFHQELNDEETREHLKHYRPLPFMGRTGADSDLVDHLLEHGEKLGFSKIDMGWLQWWYGTKSKPGQVVKFMKSFGLTKDDMATQDLDNLIYSGGQKLSFGEAVHKFLGATQQWADDEDATEEENQAAFEKVQPELDAMYKRFESIKSNPEIQQHLAQIGHTVEKTRYEFFLNAAQHDDAISEVGKTLGKTTDEVQESTDAIMALSALGLLKRPNKGEVVGGAGAAKGLIAPASTWLDDDSTNVIFGDKSRLQGLNSTQLMMVYVASELDARWNLTSRKYDTTDAPSTRKASKLALQALKDRPGGDRSWQLVKDQLDGLVGRLAQRLSDANTGLDPALGKLVDNAKDVLGNAAKAEEIRDGMRKHAELREDAIAAQQNSELEMPTSFKGSAWEKAGKKLFNYQKQAVNWIETVKRGVLGHWAGAGKTASVVTASERLMEQGKIKRAILFLPPGLMAQWPQEILDLAPHNKGKILNLSGMSMEKRKLMLQSKAAKEARYILISCGTLNDENGNTELAKQTFNADGSFHETAHDDGTGGSDKEMLRLLKETEGAVFIDEVHTGGYKNATNVRHKIASEVMAGRDYAIGMTATPMPKDAEDLGTLINLFAPGSVGSPGEWAGTLHSVQAPDEETGKGWEITDWNRLDELRQRTRPFLFMKRLDDPEVEKERGKLLKPREDDVIRAHIGSNHPINEYLKPGGRIADLVEMRIRNMEKARGEEYPPHVRARVAYAIGSTYERMALISPEMFDKEYVKKHPTAPAPKIDAVVKALVDHFTSGAGAKDGKGALVFSSLPRAAFPILRRKLAEAGIPPSLVGEIHGGKSGAERAFEQDMMNSGKRKILLLGHASGGAGLNLQKNSNRTIHLDYPWTLEKLQQADARNHRTGQQDTVYRSKTLVTGEHGPTWDELIEDRVALRAGLDTVMLTDVSEQAFHQKTEELLKKVMGQTTAERYASNKSRNKVFSDEDIAAAGQVKINEKGELDDEDKENEDVGDLTSSEIPEEERAYQKYFDQKAYERITGKTPHLKDTFKTNETREQWQRDRDMAAATSTWDNEVNALKAAMELGKHAMVKEQQDTLHTLSRKSQAWYVGLVNEVKRHLEDAGVKVDANTTAAQLKRMMSGAGAPKGDKGTQLQLAKEKFERAEKFRDSMPDAFRNETSQSAAVRALVEGKKAGAQAGGKGMTGAGSKLLGGSEHKTPKVEQTKDVLSNLDKVTAGKGKAKAAALQAARGGSAIGKPASKPKYQGELDYEAMGMKKPGEKQAKVEAPKPVRLDGDAAASVGGKAVNDKAVSAVFPSDHDLPSEDGKIYRKLKATKPKSLADVRASLFKIMREEGDSVADAKKYTSVWLKMLVKHGALTLHHAG